MAATMAADVLLPMDAVNVTNKILSGRGNELTTEDYAYAALDTVGLLGSVFTFGGSYALTRALKASKLSKLATTGAKMGKLKAIKGAFETIRTAAKASDEVKYGSAASLKTLQAAKAAATEKYAAYAKRVKELQAAKYAKNAANNVKTKATGLFSSLKSTESPTKGFSATVKGTTESTESAKVLNALEDVKKSTADTIADLSRRLDAFGNLKTTEKTESLWTKAGNALKYGMVGGTIGSVGLVALQAFGTPTEENPAGGENPAGSGASDEDLDGNGIPDWLDALFGGGSATDTGLPTNADTGEGYTDAAYPDPLGLEGGAQDVLSGLEDVPVVGDVAEAAVQNGVALPVLLIGGLLIVGGGAYVLKKTKTGKQITARVSGAVKSAGKAAKKAVSA